MQSEIDASVLFKNLTNPIRNNHSSICKGRIFDIAAQIV
jgi:hypothetical protein